MKQITLVVDDKVGVIADLSYLLGKTKINIEALSAEVQGGKGVINILVKDEAKATQVLKSNGYNVLSNEIIVIKIEDEPGALSEVSSKLQKANVSIKSLYLISRGDGQALDALIVDKPKVAKKLLASYLVNAK
ncbi:ACT domain protein [uncultured archaeon]|nr:ACT domain protein [uncultured archaeon]